MSEPESDQPTVGKSDSELLAEIVEILQQLRQAVRSAIEREG